MMGFLVEAQFCGNVSRSGSLSGSVLAVKFLVLTAPAPSSTVGRVQQLYTVVITLC